MKKGTRSKRKKPQKEKYINVGTLAVYARRYAGCLFGITDRMKQWSADAKKNLKSADRRCAMWEWVPDRIRRVFLPRKTMFKHLANKYGLMEKVILFEQYNGHWILYRVVRNGENRDIQLPDEFLEDFKRHILFPERKKRYKDTHHRDPKFRLSSSAITLDEVQTLKDKHASGELVWAGQ